MPNAAKTEIQTYITQLGPEFEAAGDLDQASPDGKLSWFKRTYGLVADRYARKLRTLIHPKLV